MNKIKPAIFILFCITVLCNCIAETSNISIKPENDTIKISEIYRADIYINYNDSIIPEFTFYFKNDSFLIPFDEERGCAVFQSIGRKEGNNTYYGKVNYITKEGILRNEKFEINFYVAP